jgi:2-polyprenyl-3-methyl-5-hydroxy-6-metoxy-1,4-benzoquinol methylase
MTMSRKEPRRYRELIYQCYVSAGDEPLAPDSLADLRPRLPYLRQLVRRYFPTDLNAVILDLGCGHGALLHVLHKEGYTNTRGVDSSPEQVAAARRLGIAGVEQDDVVSTLAKTASASLDVVVAFDVIEHFTKDELVALADEVLRVLRPGGRWIIHAPNAEGLFGGRIRYGDFTHELAFTRSSLTQLLKAGGFARVACYEDRPVPHGVKSVMRAALWALIRAGLLLILAVETGAFQKAAIFSQNLLAVAERD